MATRRTNLIEQLIEQYIIFHHEIAQIKQPDPEEVSNKAQLGIIFILHRYGKQNIRQLSELTHTTSGAVSQLVDSLVERDMVERVSGQDDKRRVEVALTEAGQIQLRAQKHKRFAEMRSIFDELTDDELMTITSIQAKLLRGTAKLKEQLK